MFLFQSNPRISFYDTELFLYDTGLLTVSILYIQDSHFVYCELLQNIRDFFVHHPHKLVFSYLYLVVTVHIKNHNANAL